MCPYTHLWIGKTHLGCGGKQGSDGDIITIISADGDWSFLQLCRLDTVGIVEQKLSNSSEQHIFLTVIIYLYIQEKARQQHLPSRISKMWWIAQTSKGFSHVFGHISFGFSHISSPALHTERSSLSPWGQEEGTRGRWPALVPLSSCLSSLRWNSSGANATTLWDRCMDC